ncbi:MAG: GNAT family N-acetyltransferase [Planctomycetia bacterium]|nr:GNAT family N-acetyltransferase [Planctomycetia bacterium]
MRSALPSRSLAKVRPPSQKTPSHKSSSRRILSRKTRPPPSASRHRSPAPVECLVRPADAAEHHAVHLFLAEVFEGPSVEAFTASLEDPFYEPSQRLVLTREGNIAGHALLSPRETHVSGVPVPAAELSWMAVAAPLRGQGLGRQLLRRAETEMAADGAEIAFARGRPSRLFAGAGWGMCGLATPWESRTREVLARLAHLPPAPQTRTIRPWRRVELPALVSLYERNCKNVVGMYRRSEAFWQWLLNRQAFDHVYVAIDGPPRLDFAEAETRIDGYAVLRGATILEVIADHAAVARQLLTRICGEAIERDYPAIRLHARPDDPLRPLMGEGRSAHSPHQAPGDAVLIKVLRPWRLLSRLGPVLAGRAREAGLPSRVELGFAVEDERAGLSIARGRAKVVAGKLGRSYVRLSRADLSRLLVGSLPIDKAVEAGRLRFSTRAAMEFAAAIFPRQSLWRPPLDDHME